MIKITVENKKQANLASDIADDFCMYDPSFNGADYEVEVGDFLSVEYSDELAACALYRAIVAAEQE